MLEEATLHTKDKQQKGSSSRPRKPQVPKAIVFGNKSWADVAAPKPQTSTPPDSPSRNTETSLQSTMRTGKTLREIELEEQVAELMEANESLQATNKSINDANALLLEENKKLNAQMAKFDQRLKESNLENKRRIDELKQSQKQKDDESDKQRQAIENMQNQLSILMSGKLPFGMPTPMMLNQNDEFTQRKRHNNNSTPTKQPWSSYGPREDYDYINRYVQATSDLENQEPMTYENQSTENKDAASSTGSTTAPC